MEWGYDKSAFENEELVGKWMQLNLSRFYKMTDKMTEEVKFVKEVSEARTLDWKTLLDFHKKASAVHKKDVKRSWEYETARCRELGSDFQRIESLETQGDGWKHSWII